MQLGFVIDHSSCIGCHACTVACKSENKVPTGNFRTWVKYTQEGNFPDVHRSFSVLRCNQCSKPPCVDICPTGALWKRQDNGIIDLDSAACIACKSCMQACPYDALYLNEQTGKAEKCHFCSHRTEKGLAPACAALCPTGAIIPGDFKNPKSRVSQLKNETFLKARKMEAGTGPNVWYKDVSDIGIEPLKSSHAGSYLWANPYPDDPRLLLDEQTPPSEGPWTLYDVPRKILWGRSISLYLLSKSLGSGLFLLASPLIWQVLDSGVSLSSLASFPFVSMLLMFLTSGLLIFDLKQPQKFYLMLTRPNFSSWLVKGGMLISFFSTLLVFWTALCFWDISLPVFFTKALLLVTDAAALLSASYTAWLFKQSKGRVLWMKKGLAAHLAIQALLAGSAGITLFYALTARSFLNDIFHLHFQSIFVGALLAQAFFILLEPFCAPPERKEEFRKALDLIRKGPYAGQHRFIGLLLGIALPLLLILFFSHPAALILAALFTLLGLYSEEDIFIRAGQTLPNS
jgi:Fe-S-cluster-containing dehydrogenase component